MSEWSWNPEKAKERARTYEFADAQPARRQTGRPIPWPFILVIALLLVGVGGVVAAMLINRPSALETTLADGTPAPECLKAATSMSNKWKDCGIDSPRSAQDYCETSVRENGDKFAAKSIAFLEAGVTCSDLRTMKASQEFSAALVERELQRMVQGMENPDPRERNRLGSEGRVTATCLKPAIKLLKQGRNCGADVAGHSAESICAELVNALLAWERFADNEVALADKEAASMVRAALATGQARKNPCEDLRTQLPDLLEPDFPDFE